MIVSKKKIERHMILNIIYKILGMAVGLIYVPIVLNYLGNRKYGVWITINTFVSWITYFDIGIGNGLRNRLTENISHNNEDGEKKTVSTAYISISIIAAAIFLFAMIIIYFFDIPKMFNLEMGGENIKLVIIINVAFICINFVLSLCNTILYSLQLSSTISLISIIPQLLNILCILILYKTAESNLILISVLYGLTVFITNIVTSSVVFMKFNQLRPNLKYFDYDEMKHISGFGIKIFVSQMAALVLNCTDNLLITKLYGAENVIPYSIVYKAFSYLNVFHMAIIAPMWSSYTMAKAKKDNVWLKQGLRKMDILLIPFAICTVILIIEFKPLAYIWLGKCLNYTPMLIEITGMYFIILMWTNIYSSFLCGIGEIDKLMWISVFQAVFNIPLSLLYSVKFHMGVNGIILGSLSVMLVAGILLPLDAKKHLKKC